MAFVCPDTVIDLKKLEEMFCDKVEVEHQWMVFKVEERFNTDPKFRKGLDVEDLPRGPEWIGLGPYHHGRGKLPNLRQYRLDALHRTFQRMRYHMSDELCKVMVENRPEYEQKTALHPSTKSRLQEELSLPGCVQILRQQVRSCGEEIQEFYKAPFDFLPDVFVLDCCFLLEVCFTIASSCRLEDHHYFNYMRIFEGKKSYQILDLLLFENQLPLFLLNRFMILTCGDAQNYTILIQQLLPQGYPLQLPEDVAYVHILDATHKGITQLMLLSSRALLGDGPHMRKWSQWWSGSRNSYNSSVPTATELKKVGIIFESTDGGVGFRSKYLDLIGVFELPRLYVTSHNCQTWKHLIAYEKFIPCYSAIPLKWFKPADRIRDHPVSTFVYMIDSLVDTAEDVRILKDAGIIHTKNDHYTNQEIADTINQLGASADKFDHPWFVDHVLQTINWYYPSKRRRRLKEFYNTYLSRAWYVIGSAGAVVLLVLTLLQTIYTMKG